MQKKQPLFTYGIIFMAVAYVSSFFGPAITSQMTPQQQDDALGSGIVTFLTWLVGIALIVMGVIRSIRNRSRKLSSPQL